MTEPYYKLDNFTSANNIYEYTKATVDLGVGGLYGHLILLAIFIIPFFFMKNYDTKVVFLVASFMTSITAVSFYFLEFISMQGLIMPIILLVASTFTVLFFRD